MKATLPRRRGQRGLTLLEVLAAAMIFAMVMTVLVGTSSTAVRRSGIAARKLEANLVADDFLTDLEIQIRQRVAPVVEDSESTREPFAIRVQQSSFAGADNGSNQGGALAGGIGGIGGDVTSLLGGELPEVLKHLKQYDIEVSWFEPEGPQTVRRTTFAFDWQAAAIEFADLFQSGAGEEGTEQPELGGAEALEGLVPENDR